MLVLSGQVALDDAGAIVGDDMTTQSEQVFRSIEGLLSASWRVVGAYLRDGGRMVGFARAISDGVALAYLADLFVVDDMRGKGLGKGLVEAMIDNGPGAGFRWMLHTSDAHGLYARFGFGRPDATYLERPGARPAIARPVG